MTDDRTHNSQLALRYEVSAGESFSEGVVSAVSAVSDVEPVPDVGPDVEPDRTLEPLYSVVDPDALDKMFRTSGNDGCPRQGRVTFSYHGYEVTVRSEGSISVERPEPATLDAAADR